LNWCPYCNELDYWGYDYCQECGGFFDALAPAEPQATERVLEVEVFGVARTDGAEMNYFRELVSSERLAALRSMPYADYVETPEWFNVRMSALDAAGSRCQVCNTDDGLDVHHRTYERRGNEVLEDLTVLCRDATNASTTSGSWCLVASRRRRDAFGSSSRRTSRSS
jgi:hypothetical protein